MTHIIAIKKGPAMTHTLITPKRRSFEGLLLSLACLIGSVAASSLASTTATFQAGVSPTGAYTVPDNDIRSSAPNTSEEGNIRWNANVFPGEIDREVVKFNISALPAGATISNISLTVYWNANGGVSTPTQVDIYRVTKDFTEADSTWNKASIASNISWTTPGGDFLPTLLSAETPGSITDGSASTFASTSDFVAAANAAFTGDGSLRLLLKSDNETYAGSNLGGAFYAEDDGSPNSFHPILSITYTVPEPASLSLIALGAAALLRRGRTPRASL